MFFSSSHLCIDTTAGLACSPVVDKELCVSIIIDHLVCMYAKFRIVFLEFWLSRVAIFKKFSFNQLCFFALYCGHSFGELSCLEELNFFFFFCF